MRRSRNMDLGVTAVSFLWIMLSCAYTVCKCTYGNLLTPSENVLENYMINVSSMNTDSIHTPKSAYLTPAFIEDDIAFTTDDVDLFYRRDDSHLLKKRRVKRKITAHPSKYWPLPIYYAFDGTHDVTQRKKIQHAMGYWQAVTCIDFVEVPSLDASNISLVFTKGTKCWSYIGFRFRGQRISLAAHCLQFGTLVHEIGHAIGLWHEQSRPDRDYHVTVHYENVELATDINFQRASWRDVTTMGVPYDLGSVMHYGGKYYSRNTKYTVEAKDSHMQRTMGQRREPSFYDIKLVNMVYCKDRCTMSVLECHHDGYPDPRNCKQCRCPAGFTGRYCDDVAPASGAICGGLLSATSTPSLVQSPGYPLSYHMDVQCNWLIRADLGNFIYLEFVAPFNVHCELGYDECIDYIEVRYQVNMATTGARFCCSDRPRGVIKSATHQMMLLFRSFMAATVGFSVKYYTVRLNSIEMQTVECTAVNSTPYVNVYASRPGGEMTICTCMKADSCGGCASSSPANQAACTREITYQCQKSWRARVKGTCLSWWVWHQKSCGYVYKIQTRLETCRRIQSYCCSDFLLMDTRCIAKTTTEISSQSPDGGSLKTVTIATWHRWSDWSPWSVCSHNCGACGKQTRERTCTTTGKCGPQDELADKRVCNVHVCPASFVKICTKREVYKKPCTPWSVKMCDRYRSKIGVCHLACCKDYVQQGNICVKQT